jgi:hypothetical protein
MRKKNREKEGGIPWSTERKTVVKLTVKSLVMTTTEFDHGISRRVTQLLIFLVKLGRPTTEFRTEFRPGFSKFHM